MDPKKTLRLRGSLLLRILLLALALLPLLAADPESAGDGYVGDATCFACHEDVQAEYERTIHAKVLSEAHGRTELMRRGCEACHGPGQAHVDAGGQLGGEGFVPFRAEGAESIARGNAVCLQCHEEDQRLYWEGSPHESRDVACTSCHTVMQRVSDHAQLERPTVVDTCAQCHLVRRSQTFRNAHMPLREGKMDCASCHNPHGTVTESLLKGDSVNETCYRCHAEKRGPFLWEHAPVTESCTNCHEPHGSTRARMLKLNPPRLCQQCHIESRHPTEARLPTSKFVIGRACLQCHTNIHGSNHPSGFAFTR